MIDRDSVELIEFVEQLRHRHLLVAPQHFTDAVVDDDRVVEGIAENGQKRGDAGQVEIDLTDRHEADRQHDVVHVGDHGAECELPFEAEPEIDQDRDDREHQAEHAVGQKFAGDARTQHLGALNVDAVAERAAKLLHGCLLRGVTARLLGNADQNVLGAAELLQLDFAEAPAPPGHTNNCSTKRQPHPYASRATVRSTALPSTRHGDHNISVHH